MTMPNMRSVITVKTVKPIFCAMIKTTAEMAKVIATRTAPANLVFLMINKIPPMSCDAPNRIRIGLLNP